MQILMFPSFATRFLLFAMDGTTIELLFKVNILRLRFVYLVDFTIGFDNI